MSEAGTHPGEHIAHITQAQAQGMITLRGDLSTSAVKNAATGVAAVDMPARGQANCVEDRGIAWMSPDELLVLCPYDTVEANVDKMRATLGDAHALAVDVSDARATFLVEGTHAREVLAKLAPVDLAPDAFVPGMFRRTRLAQVPAAFWMRDAQTFQIVCFRSHAHYVHDLLKTAAAPGSAVEFFTG